MNADDAQRAVIFSTLRGSDGDWRPADAAWFRGVTAMHRLIDEKVVEHRSFLSNTDRAVRFEIRWHPDYLADLDG
jgi:hypothetical protein